MTRRTTCRRGLVTTTTVAALLLAATSAAAQSPEDNAFTAGGDASLLQVQAVQIPDTGSLAGLGVAETATTGTVTTADSSSRNVDVDLGGQDAVDGVLVLESQAQPDNLVGQFLAVPLNDFGSVAVGEGQIVHASAFDATAPCPTGDGQDYTRSISNVESILLGPDAFTPDEDTTDETDTIADGEIGGDVDNLIDPLNDAVGAIADNLDPVTEGLDEVVDQIFDGLGLPVPGGALLDVSSDDASGVSSTAAVRLVPGPTAGRAGVQVQAVADTLDFEVLGKLLEIDVIRPAGISVTALGTPGSATVEYQAPVLNVRIAGEETPIVIDGSQGPDAFEIPGLAVISIGDTVETTIGEDGTSVQATASTARVTILDPVTGGPPALDVVIGPVTGNIADLTPGGLVCAFEEPPPPPPPTPDPLPVTGGGTVAVGLAALAGAAALRRRRDA